MKTIITLILAIVFLSSCETGYRAVQPLPKGQIFDMKMHDFYKVGDTITVQSRTNPGTFHQFKVLE